MICLVERMYKCKNLMKKHVVNSVSHFKRLKDKVVSTINQMLSGFRFFFKGLKNSKEEILVSILLLLILTFFLSIILYCVESAAQPEVYNNFWRNLVWSFCAYLDEHPDHFVLHDPITVVGKIMWAIISILKIALFAVPTGLVASGFSDAVAKEEEENKLYKSSTAIRKTFNRMMQSEACYMKDGSNASYKFVPRYRSLSYLQVKTGLNVNDIVDAVQYTPDLRLVNLSSTVPGHKQNDMLAVAHMPINTEYGCFINRDSNVTIISTSDILGPSNFAFSMAAMGCFNFVSKELSPSQVDALNFYLLSSEALDNMDDYEMKENVESQALHFIHDLISLKEQSTARGEKHWFFVVLGTHKTTETQVQFSRLAIDKAKKLENRIQLSGMEYGSTVLKDDEAVYQTIVNDITSSLANRTAIVNDVKQNIVVGGDNKEQYKAVQNKNLMLRLGGGKDCNAVTIRIGYEILVYDNAHLLKAKDMADAIHNNIEKDRVVDESIEKAAKVCYETKGPGFADVYGTDAVFESDPIKLQKKIKRWSKNALEKYERFNLDGTLQSNYKPHKKHWKKK